MTRYWIALLVWMLCSAAMSVRASDLPTHLKPDLFCPAVVSRVVPIHQLKLSEAEKDLGTDNEFGIVLASDAQREISGTIDILSDGSIYSLTFPKQTLAAARYEWRHDGKLTYTTTKYLSKPLYLQLPAPGAVSGIWIRDISVNGAPGDCATLPAVHHDSPALRELQEEVFTGGISSEDVRAQAPSQPQLARLVRKLDMSKCRTVFKDARMVYGSRPMYPRAARQPTGSVVVQLAIDAAGNVADAAVLRTSGDNAFDAAGLISAARSEFAPAEFLCVPIPGFYSFRATFTQ